MANGEKCNNIDCKTIVTDFRKNGQYKKYCCSSCRRLGIAEKCKQTSLEKYGVSNPSKSKVIKDRIKDTFSEKYGEGITNAMHMKEFKNKIIETNIEKYGTNKPQLLEKIKQKTIKSNIEKYGTDKPQQLQDFKDRSAKTCKERYGVSAPQQNREVRQKSVDTCLEKYGVENSAQDAGVYEKTMKSQYKSKEYVMPAGNIVKVQGYEPFAITYLLKSYRQEDIMIETYDKPRLPYKDDIGKNHYYFPDIHIPKDNLIIEVKSMYTYNKNIPRHMLKRQTCIDAGYNFMFMIFDKDGNLLDNTNDK